MTYRPTKLHHDIKPAETMQRRSIPVRRVVDFTPTRVRRLGKPSPALYRQVARLLGSLSLLLALVSAGTWGHTVSFYNDAEYSRSNTFTAGLVDFVLSDTPFATMASTSNWEVDVTPNDLSNPFYYVASSSEFSGNTELCDELHVTATLDGEVMYTGLLTELTTGTTTVIDTWTFNFDNFEGFAGASCKFFVDYNGWQTRHGLDQGGYSDTERVMYTITVPSLLLAKVYFTGGQECSDEPTVELLTNTEPDCRDGTQTWIELYNRTTTDIDTEGWQLCASDSCFTISGNQYIDSTVIEAGEFGIVAADPAIHTQISLPWGVTPLITDGVWFASDLDPTGDMLQLRDPDSLVIDQLNWGQLDLGWSNFTSDLWPSNSLTAASGQALARVPVTYDSNEPDDWVMLGVPTLEIDSVAPALLEPGSTTTISYTVVNPNGLNDDLRIDIYLFEPDDTLHVIELDVENSGEYTFTIPPGLDGPVRFKVVATSPENSLLNARDLTDPFPLLDCDDCYTHSSGGGSEHATLAGETETTTPGDELTRADGDSATTSSTTKQLKQPAKMATSAATTSLPDLPTTSAADEPESGGSTPEKEIVSDTPEEPATTTEPKTPAPKPEPVEEQQTKEPKKESSEPDVPTDTEDTSDSAASSGTDRAE